MSRGARREFCRSDDEVKEAVITYVNDPDTKKVTADEISKLTEYYEAKLAEVEEAALELAGDTNAANEKAASLEDQLKKIQQEKKADAAEKKALKAQIKAVEDRCKELEKASAAIVEAEEPTPEDSAKTDKARKNYIALWEQYAIAAAGDERQLYTRFHEFYPFVSDKSKLVLNESARYVLFSLLSGMNDAIMDKSIRCLMEDVLNKTDTNGKYFP